MTKKYIIERLRKEFGCSANYKNTTMVQRTGLVKKLCPHSDTWYNGYTRKDGEVYYWTINRKREITIKN